MKRLECHLTMSFNRVLSWLPVGPIVLSVVSAGMAGTPVVHFDQDFTDGSLADEVGSVTNMDAALALRTQQAWRNPANTYFGVAPAVAFDGLGGFGFAKEFRMTTVNNAVLQAGNVWVVDMSLISDVATTGSSLFSSAPGIVLEWDFRTREDFSFSSSWVAKLAPAVSDGSNAKGSLLATAYTNGADSNVEPTALGNSLSDSGLPAALNNILRARYVYQQISGPAHTRVSTQALNGNTPIGSAAHNDGAGGTFRSDFTGGMLAQMLGGSGSGVVTYSAGHGGGTNVFYNSTFTNLELGLTRLTFKQVQNTDFNTDNVTNAAGDGAIVAANVGGTNKSFFDGDVNGDGNVDATSDGFNLLQTIGGASGTASAKLNSATGQILLTTNNVSFVELLSTGNNLAPGNAVPFGSITNAAFQDSPSIGMINFAGLSALGSSGTLSNFSIGAVLPTGFTNVADLQLRYLNGSTEVFVGVTLVSSVPGDFDADGDVDGTDFVAWQTNFPKASGAVLADGDADGDADVDGADFVVWQTNFPFTPGSGASPVPEPTSLILASAVLLAFGLIRRPSRCLG
jgi:hypothetical protein